MGSAIVKTSRITRPPGREAACRRAFSLVELLVVIAVLGLLISIVIPSFSKAKMLAYSADTLSRIRGLSGAADMYYTEYRMYPGQDGYSVNRMDPANQLNTGTQIMVQRLMSFWDQAGPNPPPGHVEWGPYPDANQRKMWAEQKEDDLKPVVTRVNTFVDRFPWDSKREAAHAILYFPARLGRSGTNNVYHETDNTPYLLKNQTDPNDDTVAKISPQPPVYRTLAQVLDPNNTGQPLRAKEFVIIGSGANGKFFDYDDEMNINK